MRVSDERLAGFLKGDDSVQRVSAWDAGRDLADCRARCVELQARLEQARKIVEAAAARADSLWMAFSGADKRSSEELIRASRNTDQAIMDSVADYRDAALLASNPEGM